jgi:hypothetical protein
MARYRSYTLALKLSVLNYLENHSVTNTARKYKIDRKLVRGWFAKKDKILSQSKKHLRKRVKKQVHGRWPDFESNLYEWFKSLRDNGQCVSSRMIQAQAIRTSPSIEFCASNGWLFNFLKRHRLVRRKVTTTGRDLPANATDNCRNFLRECSQYRVPNFDLNTLINMDETSIYIDSSSKLY